MGGGVEAVVLYRIKNKSKNTGEMRRYNDYAIFTRDNAILGLLLPTQLESVFSNSQVCYSYWSV